MLEVGFGVAIPLLLVIIGIHSHYSPKIENKQKEAESEYAKEVAKICIESYKRLLQKYTTSPASITPDDFLRDMESFYVESISAQFKKLDILTRSYKPRVWLHDTISAFSCAVILFLLIGLFPYIELTDYCVPLLVVGVITIIIGIVRFWQMTRAV